MNDQATIEAMNNLAKIKPIEYKIRFECFKKHLDFAIECKKMLTYSGATDPQSVDFGMIAQNFDLLPEQYHIEDHTLTVSTSIDPKIENMHLTSHFDLQQSPQKLEAMKDAVNVDYLPDLIENLYDKQAIIDEMVKDLEQSKEEVKQQLYLLY